MQSRVNRLFAFAIGVLVSVGGLIPALPARADTDPPFEIAFPQDASKTHFSSTYGASRSGGRSHKGNDLMAPKMTEVYAIANGTVHYVGINRLSGRNVKIDHGDGWESYYLHLNNDNLGTDDGDAPWALTVAPGVEVGKHVQAGQLIGWVGDSGNAEGSGSHTHFELRHNGSALDPYSILSEAYEHDLQKQALLEMSLVADLSALSVE